MIPKRIFGFFECNISFCILFLFSFCCSTYCYSRQFCIFLWAKRFLAPLWTIIRSTGVFLMRQIRSIILLPFLEIYLSFVGIDISLFLFFRYGGFWLLFGRLLAKDHILNTFQKQTYVVIIITPCNIGCTISYNLNCWLYIQF